MQKVFSMQGINISKPAFYLGSLNCFHIILTSMRNTTRNIQRHKTLGIYLEDALTLCLRLSKYIASFESAAVSMTAEIVKQGTVFTV